MRKPVVVLGVPIDPVTMPETLDRILEMVQTGRATGKVHQVATVNVDFVVKAQFDPELRYLLQRADLLTPDGMPLVWGLHLLGHSLASRVAGADLVPALAAYAAERGLSIFLLGGAPGVASKAASVLKEKIPALQIAGTYSPPFCSILDMETSFLDAIRSAKPDILLVAFGNPKQEKWIGLYGQSLCVPVMIGVGGTLDFIAGKTRRAPEIMQRAGFEWLFRLLQEPRRLFQRYVQDLTVFFPLFVRQYAAMRPVKYATGLPPVVNLDLAHGNPVINMQGCFTKDHLAQLHQVSEQALAACRHILVNMDGVTFLDSAAVGALVAMGNQAFYQGGTLALASVPNPFLRILQRFHLEPLFPIYPHVDAYRVDRAANDAERLHADSLQLLGPSGKITWTVLKGKRIVDASTSHEIIENGTVALDTNPFLIYDLSETVLMTSAGLKALAHLQQKALHRNGEFKVIHCSEDTLNVIRKGNHDQLLLLHRDLSQSVASPF